MLLSGAVAELDMEDPFPSQEQHDSMRYFLHGRQGVHSSVSRSVLFAEVAQTCKDALIKSQVLSEKFNFKAHRRGTLLRLLELRLGVSLTVPD